jgi:hypothetical protein
MRLHEAIENFRLMEASMPSKQALKTLAGKYDARPIKDSVLRVSTQGLLRHEPSPPKLLPKFRRTRTDYDGLMKEIKRRRWSHRVDDNADGHWGKYFIDIIFGETKKKVRSPHTRDMP